MNVSIDERALLDELAPLLEGEACRTGLRNLASDPFFLAFFLASVSQGEGLGEAAVGMRQNDISCRHEGAMVKWWAPRTAAEVIHKCLTLHGHIGYTNRLPIAQRLRDVIGWQIGDGAEEVMKLLVARELLAGAAAD